MEESAKNEICFINYTACRELYVSRDILKNAKFVIAFHSRLLEECITATLREHR